MAPPALSYVYCTEQDLQSLLSPDGEIGRLDDQNIGVVNQTYLTNAINWATERVNLYCLPRYNAIDLAQSWLVNNWAVICAAHWLSTRRGNPVPHSFDDLYEEAIEDMKLIQKGQAQIPNIGLRTSAWPAWSNVRVDVLYTLRKIRVERPISETKGTNPDYYQSQDWAANFIVEP